MSEPPSRTIAKVPPIQQLAVPFQQQFPDFSAGRGGRREGRRLGAVVEDVDVPRSRTTCKACRAKLSPTAAASSRSNRPSPWEQHRSGTRTTQTFINATPIGMFVSLVDLISKMGIPPRRAPSKRQIISSHSLARMHSNSLMLGMTNAPRGCTRRSCHPIATLDGVGQS